MGVEFPNEEFARIRGVALHPLLQIPKLRKDFSFLFLFSGRNREEKFFMQKKSTTSVRIIAQIGLLVALSVILRIISPILPPPVGRINLQFSISQLIPILFGPIWGGISGGVIDLVAFAVRGGGAWLWHLTLLEAIVPFLIGILWKYIKIDNRYVKLLIVILIADLIYVPLNTLGMMNAGWVPQEPFWINHAVRLGIALAIFIPKTAIMATLLTIYQKYILRGKTL